MEKSKSSQKQTEKKTSGQKTEQQKGKQNTGGKQSEKKQEKKQEKKSHPKSPTTGYPLAAEAYQFLNVIGMGGFATVYRARVKDTKENVAIKVLDLQSASVSKGGWSEIMREIGVMNSLDHPNILPLHTAFHVGQSIWMVMPFCHRGSCAHIIKELRTMGLKDNELVATILREVLKGLLYLHSAGLVHRDVKAGNILLDEGGNVFLADFGVAGQLYQNGEKTGVRTFTGTPCWMAPEVMEHSSLYDAKADIWSFGITALELAYGSAPYASEQPMKIMLLTLTQPPPTPDIYEDTTYAFSASFRRLLKKCLQRDPARRPTAKKLLDSTFFKRAQDAKFLVAKLGPVRPWPSAPEKICNPSTHLTTSGEGRTAVPTSFIFSAEDQKELAAAVRASRSGRGSGLFEGKKDENNNEKSSKKRQSKTEKQENKAKTGPNS